MRLTTPAGAAAASIVALLAPAPVHAFNPSWTFVIGFGWPDWVQRYTHSNGFSLAGRPHEDMTKTGVHTKYPIYFGIPVNQMTRSMHSATQEIIQGSMDVDDHLGGVDPRYSKKEAEYAPAHCDDEQIGACQRRLQDMRDKILRDLQTGDVGRARNNLGRALHTLQDFYSHSNWIELGQVDISKKLGVGSGSTPEDPGLEFPVAPPEYPTCENCSYPSVRIEQAQLNWTVECRRANVKGGDPMGEDTKTATALCQAVGTFGPKMFPTVGTITVLLARIFPARFIPKKLIMLADNIAEVLSHGVIYPDCRRSLLPKLTAGPQARYLTTGYFGTDIALGETWKKGKCSHGGLFDRSARGREGIGKDASAFFISPRADLHFQAADLAVDATKKYLDDVKDTICGDEPARTCVLLNALYGVGPVLTFAIDLTGSMGGTIPAVQDAAIRIVNNVRNSTVSHPSLYILAPFNDSVVGPASAYTDPDRFIRAAMGVRALKGPDLVMGGLPDAVATTPANGNLFLWTDTRAKDEAQTAEVAKVAQAKGISVFDFSSGRCGSSAASLPFAPGRFYNCLSGLDTASTTSLVEQLILHDSVDLVSRIYPPSVAEPSTALGRRQARVISVDVPVDDSVSYVGFSANTSNVVMSITRPDGSAVLPGDPGIKNLRSKIGNTIIVDTPDSGIWKATLSGEAAFSFNSFARTNVLLPAFNFVEQRGTHHGGLFPVRSPPAPGSNSFVVATTAGEVSSATFEFRSPGGELISYLNLSRGNGTDGLTPPDNVYYGPVTVPTTAFFVYVRGNTTAGRSFVRVVPGNLDLPFEDGGGSSTPN
ncbi:hypothetical protein V8F20_004349 [Naviculisporaceae sp. PSN 640]